MVDFPNLHTYYALIEADDLEAELVAVRNALGSGVTINHYGKKATFSITTVEDLDAAILPESVKLLVFGSVIWKYFFEISPQITYQIDYPSAMSFSKNEVLQIIADKAGTRPIQSGDKLAFQNLKETAVAFVTRMEHALNIKDGKFLHRGLAFGFTYAYSSHKWSEV